MEQGLDAREAGDDVHALDLFQRAYAEEPAPRTAAQLGLCEQALGSWVEAQRHVREALATSDTWVRRNRSSLEHALTAIDEQVGTIEVLGGVDGASVRWGGQSLGALPMTAPASVVVGRATLEVTADGYVPYAIELTVRGGELTRQVVRLEEVHATPPPPPAPAAPAEIAASTLADPAPAASAYDARGESLIDQWWLWTIVGAVVVGAVVTTIVLTTQDPGVQSPIGGTAGVATALRFCRPPECRAERTTPAEISPPASASPLRPMRRCRPTCSSRSDSPAP